MRLSVLVSFVFLHLQVTSGSVYYSLTNFNLNSTQALYTAIPTCDATQKIQFQLYVHVETSSNYYDQSIIQNSTLGSSNNMSIQGTITFTVPSSNYNTIGVTAIITCSFATTTSADIFLLLSEDYNTFNSSYSTALASPGRNNPTLFLSATLSRSCDRGQIGFNCDQSCKNTYDGTYCYECDQNSFRCCPEYSQYLNPYTCAWINTTCSVNGSTYEPCTNTVDHGKQTLFMWLMIAFAILSGILIILLLLCLVVHCMRDNKKQTVAPVYVQPVRGEVIQSRRVSDRRTRSRDAPPYQERARNESPRRRRREDPRGSYQMEYDLDDDSLRNEWVESMPRRAAQV